MSDNEGGKDDHAEVEASPDVHFEPIVKLAQVEVKTCEEDEETLFKMRGRLYRFDDNQWKERGTGDLKLLRHKEKGMIRFLMRRDKTLKLCANHLLTAEMKLSPAMGSDRAFVWGAAADFSESQPQKELFALRLPNAANAKLFKEYFEKSVKNNVDVKAGNKPAEFTPYLEEDKKEEEKKDGKKEEKEEKKEESAKAAADLAKEVEKLSVASDAKA